jgi:AcrR family transcriptional regulator
MPVVITHPQRVRPGRKRSEESRSAILAAAFELFGEVGYAAMTIEGIAAHAGCGKQTIYRWWASKADVLLEAMAVKADTYVPLGDHGSYTADLRSFLETSFALARGQEVLDILCALMGEAQIDADFGDRFRVGFLQRRRDALGVILLRAADRGDLPEHLHPSTVLDIVFGVIWYRMLATREVLDTAVAEQLMNALTVPGSHAQVDNGDRHSHDPHYGATDGLGRI